MLCKKNYCYNDNKWRKKDMLNDRQMHVIDLLNDKKMDYWKRDGAYSKCYRSYNT